MRAKLMVVGLALAVCAIPTSAMGTPRVTFKARAVPIPVKLSGKGGRTYPHTGNILGAGAAVESIYTISGTESIGGVPSQLRAVTFYLPAGVKLHPQGFATCSARTLESLGPRGCPRRSIAGPVGVAGIVDPIGGEDVRENASLQAFFAPHGGIDFYANGVSPISAQVVATGHFSRASRPYGPKISIAVPLVNSVPGAPPVSTLSIRVKVGAAYRKHGRLVSYGTLPKRCPKGGFPVKSELTFQSGEKVVVTAHGPCPHHH